MHFTIFNYEQLCQVIEEILSKIKFPFNLWIEEIKQMKTKSQLGFVWGGLYKDLADYFNSEGNTVGEKNRKWDTQDVKLWIYHNIIGVSYKTLPSGEVVAYMKTMSQMNKEEMSDFISKSIAFVEQETDCILRPELKNCWLLHIDDKYWTLLDNYKFPEVDEDYLRHQLKQSCLYCGSRQNIVYHHIKDVRYSGTATKSPDWFTIPLCHNCHNSLHQHGQDDIIKGLAIYKFDLETYCKLSYIRWMYKL
jgi:hypothetical protein